MPDDYEIVPEKDFNSVKQDVEKIKSDPIGSSEQGKDLKDSIDKLNGSVNNLFNLFRTTADDLKAEEHDEKLVSERIGPLFEKVDKLTEENEKIAKGIVALAEMIEEMKGNPQKQTAKKNVPPSFDSPSGPMPQRQQFPPPQQNMPGSAPFGDEKMPFGSPSEGPKPLPRTEFPSMPAPPQQHKKKGLFGFGK